MPCAQTTALRAQLISPERRWAALLKRRASIFKIFFQPPDCRQARTFQSVGDNDNMPVERNIISL